MTQQEIFYRYCAKDSAVTYEICKKLDKNLNSLAATHYRFNVDLLNALLYMELRGIGYDAAKATIRRQEILREIYAIQYKLDQVAEVGFKTFTFDEVFPIARELMCFKRSVVSTPNDLIFAAKKDYVATANRVAQILSMTPPFDDATKGELNFLCERSLNVGSNKQLCAYLYDQQRLPLQTNRITKQRTANYEAVLKILKKTLHPSCEPILEIRTLTTRSQMLEIASDNDGRIRCGYNIVGTETGRLTCYKSPTGSGYNLQTIPSDNALKPPNHPLSKGMRDLFVPDAGYYFFQCDLSGADGWTVAAHCAALGDRTMLDDYLYGLKPAKIITLALRGQTRYIDQRCPRNEIKEACKSVEKESWEYFACKCGQHGSNYLMGPLKLSDLILVQSEGKVVISKREIEDLQRLYFMRYRGVKLWHSYTTSMLARKPVVVSASGHRRYFFRRKDEILGEALAHEPQATTTYATNLAMYNLWNDKENRRETQSTSEQNMGQSIALRIEPLHQVHDALCGQFAIADTTWAVSKINEWFNNTLIIAGQEIKIPFEGAYGLDWALNDESKKGVI